MSDFDFDIVFIVVLATGFFSLIGVRFAKSQLQRIAVVGTSFGLLVFNGIGAAAANVMPDYLEYYFGFLAAFLAAFSVSCRVFSVTWQSSGGFAGALRRIDKRLGWVIPLYVMLHAFPLFYPEIRLADLFSPPSPDVVTNFFKIFTPDNDIFSKIVGYVKILLIPFFYIKLYAYVRTARYYIGILFIILYLDYVDMSYVGRGAIFETLGIIFIVLWVSRPALRHRLILGGAMFAPFFIGFSYLWAFVRSGSLVQSASFQEIVESVIVSQVTFPSVAGTILIESGERADFLAYLAWIVTLPVPKIFTGPADYFINFEMSEVVNGIKIGANGFYALLPGVVAESVYIYGKHLFWVHAVFAAFILGFLIRVTEKAPQMLFLQAFIVMEFSYTLPRGGIASLLPTLINSFLVFYLFLILHILRQRKTKSRFKKQGEDKRNYVSLL